jgi:nitroimidazol reductase NimA-like FMN-containing flavoprotein (pyridoxamine 5'-phosphate oxidase superfamily)
MVEVQDTTVPLTEEECHELLQRHRPRLGRLAFVDDGWPLVLPLNFVADGRFLWFRTAPGSKLLAAVRMQRVTFEFDAVDEAWRDGWSVLAFGRLRLVTDPDELAIAEQLPLRPWARGDRPHYLRMDIERMTGRRLH